MVGRRRRLTSVGNAVAYPRPYFVLDAAPINGAPVSVPVGRVIIPPAKSPLVGLEVLSTGGGQVVVALPVDGVAQVVSGVVAGPDIKLDLYAVYQNGKRRRLTPTTIATQDPAPNPLAFTSDGVMVGQSSVVVSKTLKTNKPANFAITGGPQAGNFNLVDATLFDDEVELRINSTAGTKTVSVTATSLDGTQTAQQTITCNLFATVDPSERIYIAPGASEWTGALPASYETIAVANDDVPQIPAQWLELDRKIIYPAVAEGDEIRQVVMAGALGGVAKIEAVSHGNLIDLGAERWITFADPRTGQTHGVAGWDVFMKREVIEAACPGVHGAFFLQFLVTPNDPTISPYLTAPCIYYMPAVYTAAPGQVAANCLWNASTNPAGKYGRELVVERSAPADIVGTKYRKIYNAMKFAQSQALYCANIYIQEDGTYALKEGVASNMGANITASPINIIIPAGRTVEFANTGSRDDFTYHLWDIGYGGYRVYALAGSDVHVEQANLRKISGAATTGSQPYNIGNAWIGVEVSNAQGQGAKWMGVCNSDLTSGTGSNGGENFLDRAVVHFCKLEHLRPDRVGNGQTGFLFNHVRQCAADMTPDSTLVVGNFFEDIDNRPWRLAQAQFTTVWAGTGEVFIARVRATGQEASSLKDSRIDRYKVYHGADAAAAVAAGPILDFAAHCTPKFFCDQLNTIPGMTATSLAPDSGWTSKDEWSMACLTLNGGNWALPWTAAEGQVPRTSKTWVCRSDIHGDIHQYTAVVKNIVCCFNRGILLNLQILLFQNGRVTRAIFYNNTYYATPYAEILLAQIGTPMRCVHFAHNVIVGQPIAFRRESPSISGDQWTRFEANIFEQATVSPFGAALPGTWLGRNHFGSKQAPITTASPTSTEGFAMADIFENYTAGDFRLKSTSPLRGAGYRMAPVVKFDHVGNLRAANDACGAYAVAA